LFGRRRDWISHQKQHEILGIQLNCPLCSEPLNSINSFYKHTANHQEQLSLFVLPNRSLERDEEVDSEEEKASQGNNRRSEESIVTDSSEDRMEENKGIIDGTIHQQIDKHGQEWTFQSTPETQNESSAILAYEKKKADEKHKREELKAQIKLEEEEKEEKRKQKEKEENGILSLNKSP
jgi:hypothetical protein